MATTRELVRIEHLSVEFPTRSGPILPVNDVSLSVERGEVLGIVGESGSGKSVTLRAIVGLIASPGRVVGGVVEIDGADIGRMSPAELRRVRGSTISMIFQDPMASLNPVLTVGEQTMEALRDKLGCSPGEARDRAEALFARVGIREPQLRMRDFPHQFSGGMAQRVMIAMAIATKPRILLADEPTTALDVSIQDQVLDLLDDLREELSMAMILVSHDMGVIARSAARVAVMYAGRIMERGRVTDVLRSPRHPYTRMLIGSVPSITPNIERTPLAAIAGQLPNLASVREGCPFRTRCPHVRSECATVSMQLDAPEQGHGSACPFA